MGNGEWGMGSRGELKLIPQNSLPPHPTPYSLFPTPYSLTNAYANEKLVPDQRIVVQFAVVVE